jgi:hypothetical protein
MPTQCHAGRTLRRVNRRAAKVLVAAGVWTLYVWITRMWNIVRDDHSLGFKAVHTVLAVISIAFGIAVGVIGWRTLRIGRAASASAGDDGASRTAVEQRS